MDSGYVDSLLDLGINSSPSSRVAFRKVVECAPLRNDGCRRVFTSENLTQDAAKLVADIDTSGHTFQAFYYGRNLARHTEATFMSSNRSFETTPGSFFTPYRLHVTNTFAPIPELNRTDAEVVLIFMASRTLHTTPVTDPRFDARECIGLASSEGKGYDFDVYPPRQAVSVLERTDQTQVRNPLLPGDRNCTAMPVHIFVDDLSGLRDLLELNPQQYSILRRFSDVIQNSIDSSFAENGDDGILAVYLTANFVSAPLPENQWVLELQN
ncbi:hypothetical protein TI39_contig353g00052 [Zymoseptoria brevis]|uniref:Uncharacterized protein n=1 Tax=Zymoseptoria brevis TaxID=1047168 RepID=A0A0F4GRN6_9PEZI|nr:hypothetical protein TI39_contig353g00052 [Zymoseptoria brevis]